MRIIFIGTGEIGLLSLQALVKSPDHSVLAVVTQPDKPVGRQLKLSPSPVKEEAFRLHLKIFQPEKIGAAPSIAQLRYLNPDIIVVAAYGQILPKDVLNLPRYGCLNLHTSLLPKYRGASPIHSAIAAGEKESGVTIMWMDEGLDTGDILMQQAVGLRRHETAQTLHDRLAKIGAELLLKSLPLVETGNAPRSKQDKSKATLTKKLTKENGHIDWDRPQRTSAR
jgi:methionyl-tRNA formyltransferase